MYVINDDKHLIYEVTISGRDIHIRDDKPRNSYIEVSLELVCGKDYIEVNDYGGREGWVPAKYFIEDARYESLVFYFVTDSLEDTLAEYGFSIIERLPRIEEPVD